MGVLFDLDLTLVDSSSAEHQRKTKQWAQVYQTIPRFQTYEGMEDLLTLLAANKVPVCVVTTSPSTYCGKVLARFGWKADACVCYHDTREHKPHPAPLLAGLTRLNLRAKDAVAVGDASADVQAAKAAGIYAVAVTWGATDRAGLIASGPDAVAHTVDELRAILVARLPQFAHMRVPK